MDSKSETILSDIAGYDMDMSIFSVAYYNIAKRDTCKSILQAHHAGEAIEIFYDKAEKDEMDRWPIPMSIENIGKLENPE